MQNFYIHSGYEITNDITVTMATRLQQVTQVKLNVMTKHQ